MGDVSVYMGVYNQISFFPIELYFDILSEN